MVFLQIFVVEFFFMLYNWESYKWISQGYLLFLKEVNLNQILMTSPYLKGFISRFLSVISKKNQAHKMS